MGLSPQIYHLIIWSCVISSVSSSPSYSDLPRKWPSDNLLLRNCICWTHRYSKITTVDCNWTIAPPRCSSVLISFTDFHMQESNSRVIISLCMDLSCGSRDLTQVIHIEQKRPSQRHHCWNNNEGPFRGIQWFV